MRLEGGCHCGAVRFVGTGEIGWSGHCHCRDCQLTSGAPLVTWFGLREADLVVTGQPTIYRSSGRGERRFCGRCGALLFYRHDEEPETVAIATACLDDPELAPPHLNIFAASRPAFMHGFDALLPQYSGEGDAG